MDNRKFVNEFIDMDELSMPWELENSLIIRKNDLPDINNDPNIIEYIKNAKYKSLDLEEKGMQRIRIKREK